MSHELGNYSQSLVGLLSQICCWPLNFVFNVHGMIGDSLRDAVEGSKRFPSNPIWRIYLVSVTGVSWRSRTQRSHRNANKVHAIKAIKQKKKWSVMNQSQETKWAHASQPSTWETEVEGLILVWGKPSLHNRSCLQRGIRVGLDQEIPQSNLVENEQNK